LNPHIFVNPDEPPRTHDTPSPKVSPLERKFRALWIEFAPAIGIEPEYRFEPARRWRFDFAHPSTKIAVELEGGIHMQGRHNRAQGMMDDAEKYNHAASLGWRVFRLTTGMVTEANVKMIAAVIEREMKG
jgi:hypothetical protein